MSEGGEQITLTSLDPTDFFTAENSSGRNPCVDRSGGVSVCNIELFDNESLIQKTIDFFGPQGKTTIVERNDTCKSGAGDPTACKNWDTINNQLLKNYCQRIGIFRKEIGNDGECPTYPVNPFNPLYPNSQGCSKMVVSGGICQEWVSANFKNDGTPGYPNTSIQNYCQNILTPDCACQSAEESKIFDLVTTKGDVPGSIKCWWKPCTLENEGNYLVRLGDVPSSCPESVCVNVSNVFLQNDVIGKNVIIQETSTCGSDNGGTVWYKQWWFWIIVLAFIVILFAVIIYFVNKL